MTDISSPEGFISPEMHQNPRENAGSRVRLVDSIDRALVVQSFALQTKDARERILAYIEHVKSQDPEKMRVQVLSNFDFFLSTYTTKAGESNTEALRSLGETLISKVDIITTEELLATAKAVVDDNESDEIVLYIPDDKTKEAHFDSPESVNSNEFMSKLVRRYAELQGKHVTIINDERHLERYDRVNVVDDAIYSGSQLSSCFTEIARQLRKTTQFALYCARSTDAGLDQVKNAAAINPRIILSTHIGKKIESLPEVLKNDPEAFNFFFTTGLLSGLDNNSSLKKAIEYAMSYMTSTTLTITETKTPDMLSFPSRLADGMARSPRHSDYPSINTLLFPQ